MQPLGTKSEKCSFSKGTAPVTAFVPSFSESVFIERVIHNRSRK